MPQYDTDDERPDRDAIDEYDFEEALPASFSVSYNGNGRHPQINVGMSESGRTDMIVYDQRTRESGSDTMCCRVQPTIANNIENGDKNLDTLDETEGWLQETAKQIHEWRQDEATVAESLNGQVTLHH